MTSPALWIERMQERGGYQPEVLIEDGCEDSRWITITAGALKRLLEEVQREAAGA